MVDIKENTIAEVLSDKQSDFEDATDLLDDEMENLAYSGSDATSNDARSVGFTDDEFKDALDNFPEVIEDGKQQLNIFRRSSQSIDSAFRFQLNRYR